MSVQEQLRGMSKKNYVLDWDGTLTTSQNNASEGAAATVDMLKKKNANLYMVTYSAETTPKNCCTQSPQREVLCPKGRCLIKSRNWAYREGDGRIMVQGKQVAHWDNPAAKTDVMEGTFGLKPEATVFVDDNELNQLHADRRGFRTLRPDGRSGIK